MSASKKTIIINEKVNPLLELNWSSKVYSAGNGTGWIKFPFPLTAELPIEEFYIITVKINHQNSYQFTLQFSKLHYNWGFYLPKLFCSQNNLIGKILSIKLQSMNYIPVYIPMNKKIFFPISLIEKYQINKDDIYEIFLDNNEIFSEYVIIRFQDRSKEPNFTDRFYFISHSNIPVETSAKLTITRRLKRLLPETEQQSHEHDLLYLYNLFPEAIIGKINESQIIIFLNKYRPLIVPIKLRIGDIIHFMGCYFADGSKTKTWKIVASTLEQAEYYISLSKMLIQNHELDFYLSYTKIASDLDSDDTIRQSLYEYWNSISGISLAKENITIRKSNLQSRKKTKINKYGTLHIRESRELITLFYVKVLEKITNFLLDSKNSKYIWQFLFGVLEGDGYVGTENNFGINISCNIKDKIILDRLLDILDISHSVIKKGKEGLDIRIPYLQVLLHLKDIHKDIFYYYPKRRQYFIIRLLKQPLIQDIFSQKSEFNKNFIFNAKFSLSEDIIDILENLRHEIE